jgi:hypothetical protein
VPETYTIRHNHGMRSIAALLVFAACGARLESRPDASSAPDAAPICAGGDAYARAPDGTCLMWFQAPLTWVEAKAACAANGAHLASLTSARVEATAEDLCGMTDTFTGGNDRAVEGTFVWDDGQPFSYTDWRPNEPSNGGGAYEEDCLVVAASRPGKGWDDRPCDPTQVATSGSFAYLCQD